MGSESLVFVYFFSFCLSLVIHHHPCIHASTCPSICPTYLSVHRRFLHPSTHLSVRRPSVHPSVHIFLCTRASLVLNSVWHKQPLSKYLSTRRTNGRMNHWKVRLRSREPTLPGPQWVRIGFSSPCGYRWPPPAGGPLDGASGLCRAPCSDAVALGRHPDQLSPPGLLPRPLLSLLGQQVKKGGAWSRFYKPHSDGNHCRVPVPVLDHFLGPTVSRGHANFTGTHVERV